MCGSSIFPDPEQYICLSLKLCNVGNDRDLADSSLELLRAALPDLASRYPPLFSLDVFGSVIGIFELNNLSLTVPTPVEDYFLLIDGLPEVMSQNKLDRFLCMLTECLS